MDYLGAEISKKIKSAIRAKLVELGVYVDDELPDYIMVLVANKKTKSQMERDLTLFLSDHTVAFVQWLQEVLDKLQTITLAKDKGDEEKCVAKSSSNKDREKKRKSSEVTSESSKKSKSDDTKEKERKRSSGEAAHKPKKDKDSKHSDKDARHAEKEARHSDRDSTTSSKKKDEHTKSRDSREHRASDAKSRERSGAACRAPDAGGGPRSARSSQSKERESGAKGARPRRRSGQQPARADGRKHPRVGAPLQPAAAAAPQPQPQPEEDDQDVLNLSADEDELVKDVLPAAAATAATAGSGAAVSAPSSQAVAPPRQLSVRPTPAAAVTVTASVAATATSAAGGGGSVRMVNLREEAGMFSRRVVTEEAPTVRRRSRSRSPLRRREVRNADAETRVRVRRAPQSTVGAVVSRELDDTEYDPLNPAVGAVASTVRVTERPRRPAGEQPRPTLLLKAMRDAQRSTVASVRPFLVRPQQTAAQRQRAAKRESRELYTAGVMSRQRAVSDAAGGGAARAVQARGQRAGSPGQIAITVRNAPPPQQPPQPQPQTGRRRRRRSRQTPELLLAERQTPEPVKAAVEDEGDVGETAGSPEAPSSDDEDTVHVTIGKVKAHPHRKEAPPAAEVSEYRPTPVLASVDDISAIVHAVADRIKNPPPQTDRASSPTFVVTMTGLGASRFARPVGSGAALAAGDSPVPDGHVVEEEEEEEEEELEEEDLRAQLLEDRARKRAHPVVAPPPQDPEPEQAPAARPGVARCRFWPNCKLGAGCTFHHPTVPCKTFPACKFGDACLYVHPPCKFDGSCARTDCRFSHSAPRPAAAAAATPVNTFGGVTGVRAAARPGSIAAECRFFPNCTNPACPFIHPKMCRYAEACSNASCLFAHPTPAAAGGRPQFKWVAPGAI